MHFHKSDLTPTLNALLQAYFGGELPWATTFTPNWDGLEKAAESRSKTEDDRYFLANAWSKQYPASSPRQQLIASIQHSNVMTVATGHQLCLATGPAYVIYKIASTIALAKKCNARWPDRTIIPVFWMATEDHDFAEINHVYGRAAHVQWERPNGGPVGRLSNDGVMDALTPWLDYLAQNNATSAVEWIREAYQKPTLAEAFRCIIDRLFAHEDILIIDADTTELKAKLIPLLTAELLEQPTITAMQNSAQWLDDMGYTKQVNPREINLFYQSDAERKRIVQHGAYWQVVDSDVSWSKAQLLDELSSFPERFSPNVALRPLYQETLLPNIAYVGGPGEVHYWLQLKPVFDVFQVPMPVVLLRDSALLIHRGAVKKWTKLGADWNIFYSSFESIQKSWVKQAAIDLEATKQHLSEAMMQLKNELNIIDPALATAADMELNKQMQGLDALEKKMAKVIRQKEEIRLQQLKSLFDEIQPKGLPQERYFNFLDLQAHMPSDVLPLLIQTFDPTQRQTTIVMDADPNTIEVESQH